MRFWEKIMKKIVSIIVFLSFSIPAFAHSGRLDSNCGHNCSEASIQKGLCYSYHYHYGNCPSMPTDLNKESTSLFKNLNSTDCDLILESEEGVHKHKEIIHSHLI